MAEDNGFPRGRAVPAASLAGLGWVAVEALLLREAHRQWRLVTAAGPASLDEALTLLASAVAVLLCTWLGASTLAAVLTHLPGRLGRLADRVARTWAPPVSRRLAAVLVGATVTGALAPGTAVGEAPSRVAAAAPAPLRPTATALLDTPGFVPTTGLGGGLVAEAAQPRSAAAPPGFAPTRPGAPAPVPLSAGDAPGWVPTRPLQRPQPSPALVVPGRAPHEAAAVVVHRGDTLWGIVARHLGPRATEAEVATAWPAWYAANRSVIGDDPDLIEPGQVLHPPDAHRAGASR